MADAEPQVVRGIDWKSTFPFTQIFRSFRVAIHPSKLVLALLALLLVYAGGRFMDAIWLDRYRAIPGEVELYREARIDSDLRGQFQRRLDERRQSIRNAYEAKLAAIGKPQGNLADIKQFILDERARAREAALKAYEAAPKNTAEQKDRAARARDASIRAAYDQAVAEWDRYRAVQGVGLFESFFEAQLGEMYRLVRRAREAQFIGKGGVFDTFINFLTIAPSWAMRYHPVFFTIFFIYLLVIWAIFGGAIARIAAVQVARDEKLSFRQALSFSTAKFLSFLSAPIIPLLIIAVVGLLVTLGGLLFNVPVLDIIAAVLFFMALAAGFIMTLVLLGLVGGFNLMYPTIAVEGSDSFDAISRSFSYLYARPWRLLFYTIVAGIYGTLCYVFVRYFIKLMLSLTHYFVGLLIFRDAPSTEPLLNVMWPNPLTATRLSYDIDFLTLGGTQDVTAFLLAFWNYLTIGMLGAFAISFYFSANTVIYILMRHEVDATEMDDVYLEQTEEDFAEATPASSTATVSAPASETPASPSTPAAPSAPPPATQDDQQQPPTA